jgi:hypothetical protein
MLRFAAKMITRAKNRKNPGETAGNSAKIHRID